MAEHVGDHILTAIGEGGHDPAGRSRLDHLERPPYEIAGGGGAAAACEGLGDRFAPSNQVQQSLDRPRVGGRMPHALEIKFEVGGVSAIWEFVRLLVEHDFVDEPSRLGIWRGQPGDAGAGEFLLHRLQETLKIPDRKDMVLHESPETVGAVDEGVERMVDQTLAGISELNGQVGRLSRRRGMAGGGAGRLGFDGRHGDGFLES